MRREEFNNKMVEFLKNPSEKKVNDIFDQVTAPQWISVEDELPKKNGRYLVFNGITKDQEIFVYCNGIWWYNADRCPNRIVTHWMRLPQPPKGGEE